MKQVKSSFLAVTIFLLAASSTVVIAGDFEWTVDFNIRAEADLPVFRADLASQFMISESQITTVLTVVQKPADAYMVLRLGQMSSQPVEVVLENYKKDKGKGWGVIAHSLGIKPGSTEFHNLKKGTDFYKQKDNKDKGDKDKGKDKKGKKNK